MEDEKERDSFAEGMDVDLVVQDELLAGGCDPPFSEVIEGAQGSSHLQQTETALSSEDIALAPSQQADVPFDLGGHAGSLSSIENKSAEQQGAVPKTSRVVAARESKCPTQQEMESMSSEMEKLKIVGATEREQLNWHNYVREGSSPLCCKGELASHVELDLIAFKHLDETIKSAATEENIKKDANALLISNILRKYSKCLDVTNLDVDVKIKILKRCLRCLMPFCKELLEKSFKLNHEINKFTDNIPQERKFAVDWTKSIIDIAKEYKMMSSNMKKMCDYCIGRRVLYLRETMLATKKLIIYSGEATKHLENYRAAHILMKRRDSDAIETDAMIDSHRGQIISPLRLDPVDINLPGASGDSFSQGDASDELSPGRRRSSNPEDGSSRNRRKKYRNRKQ